MSKGLKKCCGDYIVPVNKKVINKPDLSHDDIKLWMTDNEIKFVGIYIDECFNWKAQCNHLLKKLNCINYFIKESRSCTGIVTRTINHCDFLFLIVILNERVFFYIFIAMGEQY